MIRLSRQFELHHPWLTVTFYTAQVVTMWVVIALLGWGWGQLRFSPVQRYYFGTYVGASIGVLTGSAPAHVAWIEKRAPDRAWQIADPEDLEATRGEVPLFALSAAARSEGWSELGYSSGGTYPQREIRDFLQADFFGGHSAPALILQPFEFFFAGWLCWNFFDRWRKAEARERGAEWDPAYRPNTLSQDMRLFSQQVLHEVTIAADRFRKGVAPWRNFQVGAMSGATVSPSQMAQPSTAKPEMLLIPVAASVSHPAAVQKGGAVEVSQPTRPEEAQRPQPVEAKSDRQPLPATPFGKPAEGETEATWDISKWID